MSTTPAKPEQPPIAHHVREMIRGLGEDVDREGLLKTPERVEASLRFLTRGYDQTVEEVLGDAIFEEPHEDMARTRRRRSSYDTSCHEPSTFRRIATGRVR